jgi:hypothetical protein
MRERMSKADRRDQLSQVMLTRYGKAQSQADFTAASLAQEAGVSEVWFYVLVGKQFRKLKSNLPGPVTSSETLVAKLRKEVAELRNQLRELKAKYEVSIKEKLAEAIRLIELLDKENRILREKVAALEKRLIDDKLVIYPEAQNNDAVPYSSRN